VNKPRMLFDYDKLDPVPAREPPLTFSEGARNYVLNPYKSSSLTHEKIAAIRAKATTAYCQQGREY
jgi:hypothetical protein